MKASHKLINFFRGGDLGFIAVVIVAYFSAIATAGYAPRAFTPFRLALLITAGVAYVVAGTLWFSWCRLNRPSRATALYFVIQLGLSVTIIYLFPSGAIFLIALPLAGQSVVLLKGRWVAVVCVAVFLMMVTPTMPKTGLLIRQEMIVESPQGKTQLIVEFEDYREVDGVKLPFSRRWSPPGFTFTQKFDEIKHNVAIDDARFAKPAQ